MRIIEVEQLSQEWFEAKRGIPSASSFDKLITMAGKPSKSRETYMYRLAGEAVSNTTEELYQSAAMLRGIEMEQEARDLYAVITGKVAKTIGFCRTEGDIIYGASPDGMVNEEGSIEIKCPMASTHVEYLLANKLPTKYFQQTQGQLLVTGREWVDFVSYYPGIKPLIIRVTRDEEFLSALRVELSVFCQELQDVINKIK